MSRAENSDYPNYSADMFGKLESVKRAWPNRSGKLHAAIEEHGKVMVTELTELFGLSEGRVRAILLEMVKAGLIKKVGKTKSVHYILA